MKFKKSKKITFALYSNYALLFGCGFFVFAMFTTYLKIGPADFQFFWSAGERVHKGLSAYENGVRLSYFNGPSLAIILSFFQSFPLALASVIWKLGIVISAISVAFYITRNFLGREELKNYSLLVILLFCTFPFRNNLANAQVVVLVSFLLIIAFKNIIKNQSLIICTLCLSLSFELKPYLVILLVAFTLVERKLRYVFATIATIIIANVVYLCFYQKLSYLEWYKALRFRGSGNFTTIDQSTLLSILNNGLGVTGQLSKIIYVLYFISLICTSLFVFHKSSNQLRYLIPLALGPILFYFSHEQDFFISVVVLILLVLTENLLKSNSLVFFVIGLGLNWTNGNWGLGVVVLAVILWSVAINSSGSSNIKYRLLYVTIGSFLSFVVPSALLNMFGSDLQYFWHNAIAFIFGFLIWVILIDCSWDRGILANGKEISFLKT